MSCGERVGMDPPTRMKTRKAKRLYSERQQQVDLKLSECVDE